jgi:hypothetical protein
VAAFFGKTLQCPLDELLKFLKTVLSIPICFVFRPLDLWRCGTTKPTDAVNSGRMQICWLSHLDAACYSDITLIEL